MNPTFLLIILASVCTMAAGIAFTVHRLQHAPEGYEDQDGFHFGRLPEGTASTAAIHFVACDHSEAA